MLVSVRLRRTRTENTETSRKKQNHVIYVSCGDEKDLEACEQSGLSNLSAISGMRLAVRTDWCL